MDKQQRVPKPMQDKFDSLAAKTDAFCQQHLNAEYQQLARAALAALARKRASPLLAGTEESWAAAVIHAIGAANVGLFLCRLTRRFASLFQTSASSHKR